jgi:plastocyanin
MSRPTVLTLLAALVVTSSLASAQTVTVSGSSAGDSAFDPPVINVSVGEHMQFTNAGPGTHGVMADAGFLVFAPTAPGPMGTWTLNQPGSYPYHCQVHGEKGVVNVRTPRAASEISYEIQAWEFAPSVDGTPISIGANLSRYVPGSTTELFASAHLPSGAKLTGIEISGCDEDSANDLEAHVSICSDPDGGCTVGAQAVSSGTPGCGFFGSSVADGPVIDNFRTTQLVGLFLGGGSTLRFRNVRVFYKRVLSPAPATATFGDVPTNDQFFRAIEALAASGITQGCGGGNFCPGDPVTRGAMAGFLARAFGLFWPN